MSALVQTKAWHRPGNKPLTESLLTNADRIYAALREYEFTLLIERRYCAVKLIELNKI